MNLKITTRRIGLALVAALALAGPALAQTYDGDWAGTLKAGDQSLRLILHVKTAGGTTTAALDSLDQGATLDASAVKIEGGELNVLFLTAGAELKAKLAPDGKALNGAWVQGATLPLTLTKQPATK